MILYHNYVPEGKGIIHVYNVNLNVAADTSFDKNGDNEMICK